MSEIDQASWPAHLRDNVELVARVSYLSDWREATPDDWEALPEDEANGYREGATAVLAALATEGWRPTAGDNTQAPDSDIVDYLEQVIYARLTMGEGVRGAARSVAASVRSSVWPTTEADHLHQEAS